MLNPYQICQQYDTGNISRTDLVDQLVVFPYVEEGQTDGVDDIIIDHPYSWGGVVQALDEGIIDSDIYEEVLLIIDVMKRC